MPLREDTVSDAPPATASPAWPTVGDIRAAAARIADAVLTTPCVPSDTLSRYTGCKLWLKFENLQYTASFKERGALNKLLLLTEDERRAGVCAMSAGNHAQGVAHHATRLGIPATIVMPVGTPTTKTSRTRELGARVIVEGDSLEDSLAVVRELVAKEGMTFVHPYDDPAIVAGQGTCGLEIMEQVGTLDTIVVPIGGGGLISGIAIAAKAVNPAIRIVGVEAALYPSMKRAVAGEPPVHLNGLTIAEGIAVKAAGKLTTEIVRKHVDEILVVEEDAIEHAVALLQEREKTVVEGAGAAGLAAVIQHKEKFADQVVALPLTGGNIDSRMFASVIMRDLIRSGKLMRMQMSISDRPGSLAVLATVLGKLGANIVDVAHDRLSLSLNPKGAVLDIVVELESAQHGEAALEAIRAAGFDPVARTIGGNMLDA
jgi:threonine dehydratase